MNAVLKRLQSDHKNVALLLQVMAEELNIFATSDRKPDFRLMREIVEYLQDFTQDVHHPQEDVLFQCIMARQETPAPVLARLLKEHDELRDKNHAVRVEIDQIYNDAMVPRQEIEQVLRQFIQMTREHMSEEEDTAYPLAERLLTDEDWKKVEEARKSRVDPLFGQVVEAEFSRIGDRLRERGLLPG